MSSSSAWPRSVYLKLIGAFLLWRGTFVLFVFAARLLVPERRKNPHKNFVAFPDDLLPDSFVRWDAAWYHSIAKHGYVLSDGQSNVAFFPGFPYLTRAASFLTGDLWSAGLWVSNVCLLASLFFIYGIARRYFDDSTSLRAATWVMLLPTSFFLSAFYSEGLFLLTVAAALYFYERDWLLAAGLAGMAAAFTRSTGVLLFPALLIGAVHRNDYRLQGLAPRLLFLLLIPAGIGAVAAIQHHSVGDALAFVKSQSAWGRSSAFPLMTIFEGASRISTKVIGVQMAFDCAAVLLLFAALAISLHTLDLAHSVFIALSVLVPLGSGMVLSMDRFAVCVVPVYFVIAHVTRSRAVERYAIYACCLLLALKSILFANWYFAG